ncbi:hypothetical protein [Pararhodobacter sp. CCB-MM2]|uniref:hypothetical protein n=1 Tax=Pararhodobacter sp. CCB-MM2 TaxID=1786003 RepID=UPI0008329A61|nr:hypothetical protein [Pararhodobacter sp. CCB-MM2]
MPSRATPNVAEFWRIDIEGFWAGNWRTSVQPWRQALAEMIGIDIDYSVVARNVEAPNSSSSPLIQVLEAQGSGGSNAVSITDDMRRGLWEETPDEPLLVLLLLNLPGAALPARHAKAILGRLQELTPLIEGLDPSAEYGFHLYDVHAAALRFFALQAQTERDLPVRAEYLSADGDFFLP